MLFAGLVKDVGVEVSRAAAFLRIRAESISAPANISVHATTYNVPSHRARTQDGARVVKRFCEPLYGKGTKSVTRRAQ